MVISHISYDGPYQGSFSITPSSLARDLWSNRNWQISLSGLGGSSSSSRGGVLLSRSVGLLVLISGGVDVVLLAGAVDGDLDSNGATVNILAVHLADGLGLEFLRGEVDESETTGLAALVAGLELLDHEAGNGTKSDLGGDGGVVGKDLLELYGRNDAVSTMAQTPSALGLSRGFKT